MTELEWQTRKNRIDTKLKNAAQPWKIIKFKDGLDTASLHACAVEEYPTQNGPADYALFVHGKLLGIIEAKKVTVNPQNVLEQAKRYARGATDGPGKWNGFHVPFLYATNGEIIHFADVRHDNYSSRRVSDFHTPDGLYEFFSTTMQPDWFTSQPLDQIEKLRPYQAAAITNTEQAIMQGKRAMLIAMATGTGKTFTTVAQIYRLLKSGAARRILFLVDRRALAAQAVRAFSSFNTPQGNKFDQEYEVYSQRFRREDFEEDEPFDPKVLPNEYLTRPQPSHTFVYVSTIQRMSINLFGFEHAFAQSGADAELEDEAQKLDMPIHAFDVIIADECHRGYTARETATWRTVMDHFDAVKIGLTATPAAHTLLLFHEVVFRYTTKAAIADGWLVDYDAVKIKSGVRIKGVFLKEGEQVGIIDTETGRETYDELEDEREFDSTEIEKKITAPESNRKIVKEIAKYAYAFEKETGRFPKILIFADNDLPHISHADQLVKICRDVFGQGDAFVQKITGSPSVDRPLQKIREFRNRPNPKIVVTVDMLSTGVDIPALEFIVFLRPVKSRILWVQMLGRGTRTCGEINKEKFVIFDCFDGTLIKYFKNTTDFNVVLPQKETVPLEQVIENIYQNIDRDYNVRVLVKRLHRIDRTMSGNAREKFSAFIQQGDMGKFAKALPKTIKHEFSSTMALLRDKHFQGLLLDYERAKKSFLVGYAIQDEVSSEVMIRRGQDYLKPQDYLVAFSQFVQENEDKIHALQVLLARPKEWAPEALEQLRTTLDRNSFPEKELRRAHELVYHKALADIISMVKHAARETEPVLSAEERVDRALATVTAGKTFTHEQQQWLGLIREHLIQNLTLDVDDFDNMPVFTRRGGLAQVRRLFPDRLESLVEEINMAIAA